MDLNVTYDPQTNIQTIITQVRGNRNTLYEHRCIWQAYEFTNHTGPIWYMRDIWEDCSV